MTHQTPTDRQNEVAKRLVNQMLREGKRGETLALAWRALFETVRGEQPKENQNA